MREWRAAALMRSRGRKDTSVAKVGASRGDAPGAGKVATELPARAQKSMPSAARQTKSSLRLTCLHYAGSWRCSFLPILAFLRFVVSLRLASIQLLALDESRISEHGRLD